MFVNTILIICVAFTQQVVCLREGLILKYIIHMSQFQTCRRKVSCQPTSVDPWKHSEDGTAAIITVTVAVAIFYLLNQQNCLPGRKLAQN